MTRNTALNGRALFVILLLVVLAGAFVLPQPICSDATGCSREEGANAGSCGGDPCCWGSAGGSCYVCYYTVGGGTTKCSESASGSTFCIDYQW